MQLRREASIAIEFSVGSISIKFVIQPPPSEKEHLHARDGSVSYALTSFIRSFLALERLTYHATLQSGASAGTKSPDGF